LSNISQSEDSTPEPIPEPVKEKKKKKKVKAVTDGDVPMRDASPSLSPAPAKPVVAPSKVDEEFDAIYIRKITTELADDLDKVRSAQDFKANSIPMLIHALKQGESLFSAEEKRRVVATSKA
jgi:ribosome assembly protein 3